MRNNNQGNYFSSKSRNFKSIFICVFFFMFSGFLFEFPLYPVFAQVVRPQVSEKNGWEKISAFRLTAGALKDEVIWRQKEKWVNDKLVPGITVIRCDQNGFGQIWFDEKGLHFYRDQNNKIINPINLSKYYYELITDVSLSYFSIKWWKRKGEDNGRVALINLNGDIIWQTDCKRKNGYISSMRPSKSGKVLIGVVSDREEGFAKIIEIWDLKRQVKKLPGYAVEYKWSPDGKEIKYQWTDKLEIDKKLLRKNGLFDNEGNLLKKYEK